jgi:mono/diheme cytochrome c family protein
VRRRVLVPTFALCLAVAATLFVVSRINISAMREPGQAESYLATQAKHLLVRRSSRDTTLPAAVNIQVSIAEGEKLYGVECATCHGMEGTTPTDVGRWMYPRAANLASVDVQQYSDAQLFWIVKNGIRLSGMPAFGKVETDVNIGNLVYYVRSLREAPGQSTRND